MNPISQHSIWRLTERILQTDPRVHSVVFADALTVDPRAMDMPCVVMKYGALNLRENVVEATFHVMAFDRVVPDRSNVAQISSVLSTILLDYHNQMVNNADHMREGILPLGVPRIDSAGVGKEDADLRCQVLTFTIQLPDTACLSELGMEPLDLDGDGYTGEPNTSFCDRVAQCDLIQGILADIEALQSSSGGTEVVIPETQVAVGGSGNILTGSTELTFSASTLSTPQLRVATLTDVGGLLYSRNTDGEIGQSSKLVFDDNEFILATPRLAIDAKATHVPFTYIENGPLVGSDFFTFDLENKLLRAEAVSTVGIRAENILSGATNLLDIFAPISVTPTRVQPGTNIFTGGTPSAPTVHVVPSPSFTNVSASTFVSGATDLSSVFHPKLSAPVFMSTYAGGNQQITSTSFANITGTTIHVPTAGLWNIEYTVILSSSAGSNGCDVALSGDMTTSYVCGWSTILTQAADRDGRSWRSWPASSAPVASVLVTSGNTASVRATISATTAGDVWVRVATEGAGQFTTVTDCQGLACRLA